MFGVIFTDPSCCVGTQSGSLGSPESTERAEGGPRAWTQGPNPGLGPGPAPRPGLGPGATGTVPSPSDPGPALARPEPRNGYRTRACPGSALGRGWHFR